MKIVHALPALIKGGGERVAVDLANAAAKDGHKVTLLAVYNVDDNLLRHKLSKDIDIKYIIPGVSHKILRYFAGLPWIWKNKKWLASQDILHIHMTQAAIYGTLIYFLRLVMRSDQPAIVETIHSVGMSVPFWKRKLYAWMCNWRDGVALMATDKFWQSFMDKHKNLLIELIANGVDSPSGKVSDKTQEDFRNKSQIPKSCSIIFGTVGQFRLDRRPLITASIFSQLAEKLPDHVHFLMVGDGTELDLVRREISNSNLEDRIHTPGLAHNPRIPMSVMDLYLAINVGPITGIAALEAAFTGIPIIALQNDINYKSGEDDWIWSHHDPKVVAEFAAKLIVSPEARSNLAKKQSEYIQSNLTVEIMHVKYLSFYNKVLKKIHTH